MISLHALKIQGILIEAPVLQALLAIEEKTDFVALPEDSKMSHLLVCDPALFL